MESKDFICGDNVVKNEIFHGFFFFFLEDLLEELPNHWGSSDYDSSLRVQGSCVQSMIGELDPTCHNCD